MQQSCFSNSILACQHNALQTAQWELSYGAVQFPHYSNILMLRLVPYCTWLSCKYVINQFEITRRTDGIGKKAVCHDIASQASNYQLTAKSFTTTKHLTMTASELQQQVEYLYHSFKLTTKACVLYKHEITTSMKSPHILQCGTSIVC